MPNEIYERTWWGFPSRSWGVVYEQYIGEFWKRVESTWSNIVSFWD